MASEMRNKDSQKSAKDDPASIDGELMSLQEKKKKQQAEIDNLSKQLLQLNNELKSKSNLLDKVKRGKPGAPAPKPPNAAAAEPKDKSTEYKHESAKVFIELKDEIEEKTQLIEQLNDKIIVQDHELQKLRGLKDDLAKLTKLEQDAESKDTLIAELKKKVAVQEEAINAWIEAMDEKKKALKEKNFAFDELLKENEENNKKIVELTTQIEKLTIENTSLAESNNNLSANITEKVS